MLSYLKTDFRATKLPESVIFFFIFLKNVIKISIESLIILRLFLINDSFINR